MTIHLNSSSPLAAYWQLFSAAVSSALCFRLLPTLSRQHPSASTVQHIGTAAPTRLLYHRSIQLHSHRQSIQTDRRPTVLLPRPRPALRHHPRHPSARTQHPPASQAYVNDRRANQPGEARQADSKYCLPLALPSS